MSTDAPADGPAESLIELDAACRNFGVVAQTISAGRAVLHMTVDDRMLNLHGLAHGGVVFLLADAAFAYAANHGRRPAVAQSALVNYLRPVHVGERLEATAVERGRAGRSMLYDVTVRAGDGSVVAEMRGQCQLLSSLSAE